MDMILGGSQVKTMEKKFFNQKHKRQKSAISRSYNQLHRSSHEARGFLSKAETKTACHSFPQYSSQVHISC